mmetsp:Transcript_20330/g.58774  ORF Transcript_20330/g.58774 Transcript_20330/m.58774 type:complete len:212 (-) Transcript_20330:966-1601(-)
MRTRPALEPRVVEAAEEEAAPADCSALGAGPGAVPPSSMPPPSPSPFAASASSAFFTAPPFPIRIEFLVAPPKRNPTTSTASAFRPRIWRCVPPPEITQDGSYSSPPPPFLFVLPFSSTHSRDNEPVIGIDFAEDSLGMEKGHNTSRPELGTNGSSPSSAASSAFVTFLSFLLFLDLRPGRYCAAATISASLAQPVTVAHLSLFVGRGGQS